MGSASNKGKFNFNDLREQLVTNVLDLHHLSIDYQTEINYQAGSESSDALQALDEKKKKILKDFHELQDFIQKLDLAIKNKAKLKEKELLLQAYKYLKNDQLSKAKIDLAEIIKKRKSKQLATPRQQSSVFPEMQTINVAFMQEGEDRFVRIISPRGEVLKTPFKRTFSMPIT